MLAGGTESAERASGLRPIVAKLGRSTVHDGRRPLQSVAVALGCSRGGTRGQGDSSLCLPLLSVSGEAIRYSVISYQLL